MVLGNNGPSPVLAVSRGFELDGNVDFSDQVHRIGNLGLKRNLARPLPHLWSWLSSEFRLSSGGGGGGLIDLGLFQLITRFTSCTTAGIGGFGGGGIRLQKEGGLL